MIRQQFLRRRLQIESSDREQSSAAPYAAAVFLSRATFQSSSFEAEKEEMLFVANAFPVNRIWRCMMLKKQRQQSGVQINTRSCLFDSVTARCRNWREKRVHDFSFSYDSTKHKKSLTSIFLFRRLFQNLSWN
jgi:hypothetical protein